MKHGNKALSLVLAIVMLAMMVACAPQATTTPEATPAPAAATAEQAPPASEAPAKKLVFGATFMSMNNAHFQTINRGLKAAVEAKGYELVTLDPDNDPAKQMTQLDDFIQMGIAGLFISPVDGSAIVPGLEAVMAAGIPVIAIDAHPANEDELNALVSANNYQCGYLAGKALCEAIGGKGKVGFIDYYIPDYTVEQRGKGFKDAVVEYPDVEIVLEQPGKGNVDSALPIMEDFLQTEPDLVGVFCINDPTAAGAISACEGANRTDIKITSVDGSQDAMKFIKAGKQVATSSQMPEILGSTGAQLMFDILDGKEVKHYTEIDVVCITAENVDQYLGK